jgi:DNA-binding FrmR family transcriptional regulator
MPQALHDHSAHSAHAHTQTLIAKNEKAVRAALVKARGMIGKIEKMLDEDRYCIDISQQVNAVIGILRGANKEILESHLRTCGVDRLGSGDDAARETFIAELLRVTDVASRKA